jgi:hypothetical protein
MDPPDSDPLIYCLPDLEASENVPQVLKILLVVASSQSYRTPQGRRFLIFSTLD